MLRSTIKLRSGEFSIENWRKWNRRKSVKGFPSISGMKMLCLGEGFPKVKHLRKVIEALVGTALAYDGATYEGLRLQFGVPFLD